MFKVHKPVHFIKIDLHSIVIKDKTKIYYNPNNERVSTKYL